MSTKQEQKDQFQKAKDKFQKKMSEWSPEELQEHLNALSFDALDREALYLGDFSWDPNNVYYWHTVERNSEIKLAKRFALGYRYATPEDASRAKISLPTKLSEVDGSSIVIADHGDVKAILLKIPKEVKEFNQKTKENLRAKERNRDYKGNEVQVKNVVEGHKDVRQRYEGSISIDDIMNSV